MRIDAPKPPYEPTLAAAYARCMGGLRPPLQLYRAVAASPRLFVRLAEGDVIGLSGMLAFEDDDPRRRELIILRTCARQGCDYEFGVHVGIFSKAARLTPEEVAALARELPIEGMFDDQERLVLGAVDDLVATGRVQPERWEALRVAIGDRDAVELVALAGLYTTVSWLARTMEVPAEEWAPQGLVEPREA